MILATSGKVRGNQMHTVRIVLIGGLALALAALSVLCCFTFGTHLAPGNEGKIYGVLGGVADALKAVLPIGIAAAWTASQRARALAGVVMFAVFSTYSFASELGLYALSRDAISGTAKAGKEIYEELKTERERIAARLKELGPQPPAGAVRADIAAARQNRLWTASGECKGATLTASRTFCAGIERLQGQLAAAEEAERLRGQDDVARQKLAGVNLASVMQSTDPQSEALSRFTGLSTGTVRDALALLVALLIELGSGLGLWIATAGAGQRHENIPGTDTGRGNGASSGLPRSRSEASVLTCSDGVKPKKASKADPVRAFLKQCCATKKDGEATAAELHRAFQAWAAAKGYDSLSQKALGTRLGELGYARGKRGGVCRYRGIALV